MKARKKAAARSAKRSGPPMEYAGDWVCANTWFKLGLTKVETAALKIAAGRILNPKWRTSAEAALCLVRTALAHYDVIEPLIFADAKYAHVEGFYDSRAVQDAKIEQVFARLASKGKRRAR